MLDPAGNLATTQSQQVDALVRQAKEVFFRRPELAAQLLEQAIALAQAGPFAAQPYLPGLTAALAVLGRLVQETQPDQAARHCLRVLALLEGQPLTPALVEAQNCLGWIYLRLGEYSTSLEWAHRAMSQAKELNLLSHQAASFDLQANIHSMLGEYEPALRAHEAAIALARSLGNTNQAAHMMNNLAMTQLETGQYETALATGQACLEIFEELESIFDLANAHDTLAEIYLGMGNYEQAETHLQLGLAIIARNENQVIEAYLLRNLGRVYLAEGDLSRAVEQVERALAIARRGELRGEQLDCLELLADIYERQADYRAALAHFKQYHALNQALTGENATRRMNLLQVIHEVENARHEAEIYRLHNRELQSEIEERQRIQDALQELATRDSLTGLFNRRHFMEKSEQEYALAIRYRYPLAVIMLDLDHFKEINDTYGHPVGDQVLAKVADRLRGFTRIEDISGRMGGEEFALVLPKTNLAGASQAAERLCRSFADEALALDSLNIHLTISIGITCCTPGDDGQPPSFDTLLQQADQALYLAKNTGRSQVCLYSPQD